jgi:hypothetical protein
MGRLRPVKIIWHRRHDFAIDKKGSGPQSGSEGSQTMIVGFIETSVKHILQHPQTGLGREFAGLVCVEGILMRERGDKKKECGRV